MRFFVVKNFSIGKEYILKFFRYQNNREKFGIFFFVKDVKLVLRI